MPRRGIERSLAVIGWRRARRRGSGQPGGEAEAPPALATNEPPEPGAADAPALEASGPGGPGEPGEPTVLAETIGHEPSEPPAAGPDHDASQEAAADDLSATEHAEPATEHVTPRGAAALAEMLLTTDGENTDAVPTDRPTHLPIDQALPTDQLLPTASTSPATRLTEDATPSEAGDLAGSGTGAPAPLPTVVDLDLEPAEHVHWAVAAVVVLVTGAAVATLLLLAGHVI